MTSDPLALAGKVALVTGASRGIGAAIATELRRRGARVIGTATTAQGAAQITAALAASAQPSGMGAQPSGMDAEPSGIDAEPSGMGIGVVLDVRDGVASQALIDRIVADWGGPSILVNNAGITRDTLALRMKDDDWDQVIATNLTAAFRLARQVLRPMMKARSGRIINITSVVGSAGNPGQTNYAAAKAGVAGMARALAQEVGARGITVNCVAPGFIDTDMTRALPPAQVAALTARIPLARFGQAADVAAAVAFLASDAAGYITGVTLPVNGGMYMD